jgi:hypothetical protein
VPVQSVIEPFLLTKPELHQGKFFLNDSPGFTARINWEKVSKMNYLELEKTWNRNDYRQYSPAVLL